MDLRRILLAGITGALVLAGTATGYAFADVTKPHDGGRNADVTQTSRSTQDGNSQNVEVVDTNVCGNTVSVIGAYNPAFGNTCVNQ